MSCELRYRASLFFNVALAAAVLVLVRHRSEYPPAPSARASNLGKATSGVPIQSQSPRRYTDIASESDRRRWVIDQLRAAGVPNRILARVATADFEEQWQRRFEQGPGDAESMAATQVEQDMSRDAAMRAALGDEGFRQWDQENMLREALSGKVQLTPAETDAIYALKKKLQQRQRELELARSRGTMDDRQIDDAVNNAFSEFNEGMKSLLGNQRYAQSQGLDEGTAAANLQRDLAKVNPNDSQLQSLLKAQQQWNDRRSEIDRQFKDDASSAAYADQIKALDEARDQEYQRVLGPDVFDHLQKEQDIRYSKMRKYRDVWGLDDNSIDYVYRAVRYYEKVVDDYERQTRALEAQGQAVDWTAAKKSLAQFGKQSAQALQSYLGADRFEKLQRSGVVEFEPAQPPPGRP